MYFNAQILATVSLYLSAHAQWLQTDDGYGSINEGLTSRSIEDSDLLAARSYETYGDAFDAEFYRRSFEDLQHELYIREAKQTGATAKAGSTGGSANSAKGGSAEGAKGGSTGGSVGEAKSAKKGGSTDDSMSKSKASTKGDSSGGSVRESKGSAKGGEGSKLSKSGSGEPKFQFSKEQKAKLAAKYGGESGKGRWSFSRSTGRRYFTDENGKRTRFRQDENGKIKVKQYKSRPSKGGSASSGFSSDESGSGASSDESGGGMGRGSRSKSEE